MATHQLLSRTYDALVYILRVIGWYRWNQLAKWLCRITTGADSVSSKKWHLVVIRQLTNGYSEITQEESSWVRGELTSGFCEPELWWRCDIWLSLQYNSPSSRRNCELLTPAVFLRCTDSSGERTMSEFLIFIPQRQHKVYDHEIVWHKVIHSHAIFYHAL